MNTTVTAQRTPVRYASIKNVPPRYNFAEAMPNATFPAYWLARTGYAKATHRIYRAFNGTVLRTVRLY